MDDLKTKSWERRPEDRPGQLLAAAFSVFSERGYRNASLEEVAEKAGVTKGTIYHYFEGKEDLLLQALGSQFTDRLEGVDAQLSTQTGPIREILDSALEALWTTYLSQEWFRTYRLMVGEVGMEHPEVLKRWLRLAPSQSRALLSRIVERGQIAGEFDPTVDHDFFGSFAASALVQQAVLRVHFGDPQSPGELDLMFKTIASYLMRVICIPVGKENS